MKLKQALCLVELVNTFAHARLCVDRGQVFVNGVKAESCEQEVHEGDVISTGKRERIVPHIPYEEEY